MPRHILVIVGHPDPSPDRLCRALANAYAEGASRNGHTVRRIDLRTLDYPWLRTMEEFEHGVLPDSLKETAEAVRWAEHLVFVFPLWLGTLPAMLKAFLEHVMRPGVAFEYSDKAGAFTKTLLDGRSARIVVTMGMPAFFYRFWYFGHGTAAMRRNILNFVGIKPVRETFFGSVASAGNAKHARWVGRMRKLGERAS